MATIQKGTLPKTVDEYIAELYEKVGRDDFPVEISVAADGSILTFKAETEWPEGTTIPIEAEVEVEKTIQVEDTIEQEQVHADGTVTTAEIPFFREEVVLVKEMQIVDYEDNYETKELTSKEIDAVNAFVEQYIS